ncbi:DUF3558 family protein [Saccharomonospora piscinae]|uniref:DUF3558 family protein n=1 Tax=Saccharomonospora piscinae TaxID=687388 RepID=UPI00111BE02F|nr:DUF3558 family protein [Saccharomonospora piscinae]
MVLLTAGCTSSVRGTADAGDVPALTAQAAFGDFATVDFCSLVNDHVLRDSPVTVRSSLSGLVRCYAEVEIAEAMVQVTVGDLYTTVPFGSTDENRTLARSVHRLHFDDDEGTCWRELVFADDVGLQIMALPVYGHDDMDDLCRAADSVTDAVAASAFAGSAESRTPAADSLAGDDACEVLDVAEVADVLGRDLLTTPGLGGHACYWGRPDDPAIRADVEFDVMDFGADLTGVYPDDVAGRPSRLWDYSDGCWIETPHMAVPAEATTEWEVVTIWAEGGDGDHCETAMELAEIAWPRLPEFEGDGG